MSTPVVTIAHLGTSVPATLTCCCDINCRCCRKDDDGRTPLLLLAELEEECTAGAAAAAVAYAPCTLGGGMRVPTRRSAE